MHVVTDRAGCRAGVALAAGMLVLAGGEARGQDYRAKAAWAAARVDRELSSHGWSTDPAALDAHEAAPEWFLDAKLGIYFHWGVYSVPAFDNEWYPRNMHIPGSAANVHHTATYGDPSKFGYEKFVEKFKAERFDAAAWASLFKAAGARFAGPVFEHHDGYSMWKSVLTPWNVVETGPHRDVAGELSKAIRAEGMKFLATFHHGFNGQFTERETEDTGFYPRKDGWPTTSTDPRLRLLYGNLEQGWSRDLWLGKLAEAIDGYQPDMIWFDFCIHRLPASYQNRFLAYYFGSAKQWGKDVVVTCKNHDLPVGVAVEDFEKGRQERKTRDPWLTDDTISLGSWCYTSDLKIKPAGEIIQVLADIVSKNGILLLNISPRADGVIPEDQEAVLRQIGRWLAASGDAIYATRPWIAAGEGPTKIAKGGHFVDRVTYTAEDIRYTRSKDGTVLYAIVLGRPNSSRITLHSVRGEKGASGKARLLGLGADASWSVDEALHVVVDLPSTVALESMDASANAIELTGGTYSLHDDVLADTYPELTLDASKAVVDGVQAHLETIEGRASVGYWDRGDESVHWLARFADEGEYDVRAEIASQSVERMTLRVGDDSVQVEAPSTGSWRQFRTVNLGSMRVGTTGVKHVRLSVQDPSQWHAVNIRRLMFVPHGE